MKHPDGSEVNYRQCFEAPPGWLMCSADFSGQELAVMSAMSDDPIMMRTLNEDGDLHSEAAAAMFNIPLSEVRNVKPGDLKDNTYRDYGKIVNFSLAYGKTAAGFAADWKIDKKEAEDIINKFNKKFSVLSHWLSSHGKIGDEQGFSRLDFGPIRFVGQAKRADKDAPKRASMNYQIQGLSSWMTRLAMNMLDEISFKNGYNIKLVATIHDEILSIFKCDPTCKTGQAFFAGQKPTEEQIHACVAGCAHDCAYKYEQVIESCMRRAGEHFLKHKVPAAATVGTGKHWKH
jgi:DNA polymerase-1